MGFIRRNALISHDDRLLRARKPHQMQHTRHAQPAHIHAKPNLGHTNMGVGSHNAEVQRHGQGAKRGTQNQAIGRSKGGMTTKILALTDALGNLVRFVLLPGHRFDAVGVAPLIDRIAFGGLIADKAFDGNAITTDPTSAAQRS